MEVDSSQNEILTDIAQKELQLKGESGSSLDAVLIRGSVSISRQLFSWIVPKYPLVS